jgi:2-O-methyltransferase
MMIPFEYLVDKFKIKATGVVHIGANRGQEALIYKKFGINKVIWIEALLHVFTDLVKYLKSVDCLDENVTCINACIGDVDDLEVEFHESNNEAQSSSYLELGVHKEIHPTVEYINTTKMKTNRIETILHDCDIKDYQLLNIDIQGPELQALKGMGMLLHHFKYAIIEVNMRETYKGGALVHEIDNYMSIFDFVRAETGTWVAGTWTDAFYIKKYLL